MPFQNTKPQYIINQYNVTMGFSITTLCLPKDKRKRRRIKRRIRQMEKTFADMLLPMEVTGGIING